jgi:hypothetical protein
MFANIGVPCEKALVKPPSSKEAHWQNDPSILDVEFAGLMSQIARSKKGRGGRRKLPLAFTEHGAIMAENTDPQNRWSSTTVKCNDFSGIAIF